MSDSDEGVVDGDAWLPDGFARAPNAPGHTQPGFQDHPLAQGIDETRLGPRSMPEVHAPQYVGLAIDRPQHGDLPAQALGHGLQDPRTGFFQILHSVKMPVTACSAFRKRSDRLRCVMSRAMADAPVTMPLPSRMGEMLSSTSIRRPSLRTRTVSKAAICSPWPSLFMMSSKSSGASDLRRPRGKSTEMCWPSISAARYP